MRNEPILTKHGYNPQHLSDEVWWYGTPAGIEVVHEIRVDGKYIRTDQFTIPKKRVESYLAAVRKAREARGK